VLRHAGSGPEEVAALVALGLGVALVPAGAPVPPGTLALPLVEPEVSHPIVLAAAAGRPMNRAVGALVKLARAGAWDATA
jgi:DNA-binding transcriptional LysR family regulator